MSDNARLANKQTVRRLFETGFNQHDATVIAQLVSPDYVDAAGERGPGAFTQVMDRLRSAFPDLHYAVEVLIAEDDEVAIRWHWSGTHLGTFRGIAPTQRSLTNSGAAIFRLHAGKIVAAALETDRLGFLQSIGVVPHANVLFEARPAEGSRAP